MTTQRPIPLRPDFRDRPSTHLFRAAAAHVHAFATRSTPEAAVKALFGKDAPTEIVLRAAADPAGISDATWAGALAQQVVDDAIASIAVLSASAVLIDRGIKVDFGGYASIRISGRIFDPNNAGAWVGEGQPIPARNLAVTGAVLSPRKLAVLTTFTREIAESSNVEAVARAAISESTALALDAAMFATDPDDGIKPAGLLHGVAPLVATAGGGAAALAGDVGNLLAALAANGAGIAPVFIAAPQQVGALKVWAGPKFDYPLLASAVLAAGTVIAIEASAFASAFSPIPEFSSCVQGVLHEDTVPLHIVDGSGTPAPGVRSLWQTDTVALRMVLRASYGMRGTGLVQVIQNVTW